MKVSLVFLSLCGSVRGFSSSSLKTRLTVTRPITGAEHSKLISFATLEERKDVEEDQPASKFLEDPDAPNLLGKPIPYSELTIGVLKETYPGENRVSQTPDSVHSLVKEGFTVVVEAGGKYKGFLMSNHWSSMMFLTESTFSVMCSWRKGVLQRFCLLGSWGSRPAKAASFG